MSIIGFILSIIGFILSIIGFILSIIGFTLSIIGFILSTSVAQSGVAQTTVVDVGVAPYSHPRCLHLLNVQKCSETNKRTLRNGFGEGLRHICDVANPLLQAVTSGCRIAKK